MKMTAVIIEDEIPAAQRLNRMLESKGFKVVTHLQSVRNAVYWLENNSHPEFLFLDIKLSDGDAFSILKKVKPQSKIVFTTAYDEFALKAFENNGIAYLLKPIDGKKLDSLLNSLEYYKSVFTAEGEALLTQKQPYFMVSFGTTIKKIPADEVLCFYSYENVTFLLSKDKRSYVFAKSLEKLESELNASDFYRINRKVIVNKHAIALVKNHTVVLDGETDLDLKISRLRQKAFKEWYQ